MDDGRREWWTRLARMVAPVFSALAEGRLREAMPVEARDGAHSQRCQFNQLEAVARSLAGAAPWFDCPTIADPEERAERERLRDAARAGLARLVDPADRDMGEFRSGKQPVVDAAFLAHALLRAPQFWADLDPNTRERLHARLRETRSRRPWFNNWLLFGATTEAFLAASGAPDWDPMRIDYALRQHEQWYVGDGIYGDGIEFHADYYNSYVIQPMLLDVLETMVPIADDWAWLRDAARARALRYAAILERSIAPDGTFPPLGRSLAYRCGAFQHLAQMALRDELPEGSTRGQVRAALAAVIAKTLDAPGAYDGDGWLRIGLAGHQPSLGENYISTGSCYLASTAFLPLGLESDHPFWREPAAPWTAVRIFAGEDLPCDHALKVPGRPGAHA